MSDEKIGPGDIYMLKSRYGDRYFLIVSQRTSVVSGWDMMDLYQPHVTGDWETEKNLHDPDHYVRIA